MTFASDLAQALRAGDRRSLAKAVTLVESSRPADQDAARELLALLSPVAEAGFRVGVTGVPGAGKSTLIDALGCRALADGHRVAVLAVDPSSRDSGGSLLGDKTRMTRLALVESAFIRPSPTRGVLGGTAARTREVIVLCEAAGYDLLFVETVGVGQSEERVAGMVDCVLLLLLAGAGDELSSMKRGVLEAADLVVFNKADGDRVAAVEADAASLRASLAISRAERMPEVLLTSAREGLGIDALWQAVVRQHRQAEAQGSLGLRRTQQRKAWFESALEAALKDAVVRSPELARARALAERDVAAGTVSAPDAAHRLVAMLLAWREE